jgi:histidyl-tRNA synthetase
MKTLSNLPIKGTSDWFPEEFKVRKYIFDKWREVCTRFGYLEYLTPIVENAEIYRAKSGEDVAGPELMVIKKEDEELAIRPEMTPSVARMVTRFYESKPKPIRLFSIANFMRFQKPQRGRNREFWQLNFDIFGSNSINSDIEVLQIALEIMLAFNPPKEAFTMFINNRKLIDFILNDIAKISAENRAEVVRILDKSGKLRVEQLKERFKTVSLSDTQIDILLKFINSKSPEELSSAFPEVKENDGFNETLQIISKLEALGYADWVKFQPNIIRGFDYYDGMVFEVFDNNPENNRSLFGGGRYNGLAGIFGKQSFPAVGCAPGDETLKLFLESWSLLEDANKVEEKFYIPALSLQASAFTNKIAQQLRSEGKIVEVGLEPQDIRKSLDYANKTNSAFTILLGDDELSRGVYIVKDMKTGEQREVAGSW